MKRVRLPRLHCALLGLLPMLPEDRLRQGIRLVGTMASVDRGPARADVGVNGGLYKPVVSEGVASSAGGNESL